MGTVTLSVPDELKSRMNETDWINWSSVARHAFAERLDDLKELQLIARVREISEIPEGDSREVDSLVVNEVVESLQSVSGELKSGKRKAVNVDEFNEWCDSL